MLTLKSLHIDISGLVMVQKSMSTSIEPKIFYIIFVSISAETLAHKRPYFGAIDSGRYRRLAENCRTRDVSATQFYTGTLST